MYIAIIPNRNSPPAVLLRESYRENGKVKTRTLANLSKLPSEAIETLRQTLKGKKLLTPDQAFEVVASAHHGHVQAVLTAMQRLRFAELIDSQPSPERDRVAAMVVSRLLEPDSKLATTRWWSITTLPELFGVGDADEDDLYKALDWLLERQERIEAKLAARHLGNDAMALYDLSSSYFEGHTCPLAARGYNRDGKKGKFQVNYGLLTNAAGIPVSVSVFKGNTSDTRTLLPQADKMRKRFGIERFVLVGDRGMIAQKQIDVLRKIEGIDWISALRPETIQKLLKDGAIQMSLFDERNLFELDHPDFPGERLVACRNPELARRRADKRTELLKATERELKKVQGMAGRGKLRSAAAIGVRVGKVVNKYKVAKHYRLDIRDDGFDFELDQEKVAAEEALDGVYLLRTSVKSERMSADNVTRSYKQLSNVEKAFRSFKSIDLAVRPIRHRLEKRVRAHIFLCMLAYYVQWHLCEAWKSLLFIDEDTEAKVSRDPVKPAERSASAKRKARTHRLEGGGDVHSFRTLLSSLSSIVRNICHVPTAGPKASTFEIITIPTSAQQHAFDLLETIEV